MEYEIDLDHMTVIVIQNNGERDDLNADGEEISSGEQLAEFVVELHEQGAFGSRTRDNLLCDIGPDFGP